MAQWSRVLVLTEAPGSMPNTHVVADQPLITLALGGSNAPPWFFIADYYCYFYTSVGTRHSQGAVEFRQILIHVKFFENSEKYLCQLVMRKMHAKIH